MAAPSWMNDIVRDFGRQMGLERFALSDRGTAGVRFENGVTLRLEYIENSGLLLTAGRPIESSDAPGVRRLFASVHPEANKGRFVVRASVLAHAGELAATVKMDEREVSVPNMQEALALVWGRIAPETGGAE